MTSLLISRFTLLAVLLLSYITYSGHAQNLENFSLERLEHELHNRHQDVITKFKELSSVDSLNWDRALDLIKENISPLMDYDRFTSTAIGKYWRKFSPVQKDEATEYFEIVLQNSYSRILSEYKDETIEIVKSKILPNDNVSVNMEISNGERKIDLNYIMDPITMKVIDVRIENISLLSSWRRQFNSVIKRDGVEGFLQELKSLAAESVQPK